MGLEWLEVLLSDLCEGAFVVCRSIAIFRAFSRNHTVGREFGQIAPSSGKLYDRFFTHFKQCLTL